MALKPCKECGENISTKAKSCPHCGIGSPALNEFHVSSPMGCAIVSIILIIVIVIIANSDVPDVPSVPSSTPESSTPAVFPEIATWLKAHPTYGTVQSVREMPDWASGKRQQVRTTKDAYLFYMENDEVVTVYINNNTERREVWRKPNSQL